uniref:Uncharacterized protein n=1 Tax=Pristionchus pacificus TaxID=54126 RepID=A0A2A6BKL5_PRIPA|eukprot:PDM66366.1 hypothetical protein PRIPAC_47783 [Pristionchus pacificus]
MRTYEATNKAKAIMEQGKRNEIAGGKQMKRLEVESTTLRFYRIAKGNELANSKESKETERSAKGSTSASNVNGTTDSK